MRSRPLRIEGNLNSKPYKREVLQPEVLSLLQATPHAIFHQDNARLHISRVVQAFFKRRRVTLLPWPPRSPTCRPSNMVGRQLIRQGPPVSTPNALWTRLQIEWRNIPQEDIQGFFDSMLR